MSGIRDKFLLLLLVVGASLFFIDQPFHIDDRIYLEVAGNILEKPLHPYDYRPVFEGWGAPDAASHSHLPLTSYYLALIKLMNQNEHEWIFHVAFLIFPILAAFAFYDLAKPYVRFPLAAASLLAISPAFFTLSHTLMTEVPLLAFWILALSRFFKIADGEATRSDRLVCGLSLLASAFISLLSFGLLALLMVYLMLGWKNKKAAYLLLLPVLLWFAWYLLSYLHYDRFVLVNTFKHLSTRGAFSWQQVGINGLSFTLNLGAVSIFPLALWYAFAGRATTRIFLLTLLLSFIPFYLWLQEWDLVEVLLFALFFSSGLLVLWKVISLLGQTPTQKELILILWLIGVFSGCLFAFYNGSVRYAVLAFPPVILLWVQALENRVKDFYFLRNLVWLGVVLTGIYALPISYADYQFAQVYRQTAEEIRREYQQGRAAKADQPYFPAVWFTGEWGFRYYMAKSRAQILPRTATGPRPGDLIVKPYIASPWVTLYDSGEYTDLVEQRYAPSHYRLRILDFNSRAGFYSTGWGLLPFSIARRGERWEWFNVFRVKKPYTGPLPEPGKHW